MALFPAEIAAGQVQVRPGGQVSGIQGSLEPTLKIEPDTDRPGQNFRVLDLEQADPSLCAQACRSESRCRAYTYVKPGIQGPKARCWLKSGVPPAQANTCCASGVKADQGVSAATAATPVFQATPLTTGTMSVEHDIDRPGANLRVFDLDSPDHLVCAEACQTDAKCVAYTFVRPRVQGPKARCWLKSAVPPSKASPCCISGVKQTAPAASDEERSRGPIPASVMAKLTAPVSPAVITQSLQRNPRSAPLLSKLPQQTLQTFGGSLSSSGGAPAGGTSHRAPSVPSSVSGIDWRSGVHIQLWREGDAYVVGNQKYFVASVDAIGVRVPDIRTWTDERNKGVARIYPNAGPAINVLAELPGEAATYSIVLKLTDVHGSVSSSWVEGNNARIRMRWTDGIRASQDLPLAMLLDGSGWVTLLSYQPPPANAAHATWVAHRLAFAPGMRDVSLWLMVTLESSGPAKPIPIPPYLFGGITIRRIY